MHLKAMQLRISSMCDLSLTILYSLDVIENHEIVIDDGDPVNENVKVKGLAL